MRKTLGGLCALFLLLPSAALGQEEMAATDARAAIEEGARAWEAAWNAGDADAIAALYADDAVLLPPGSEPVEGREAIRAYWRADIEQNAGVTGQLETRRIDEMGEFAVELGSWKATGADGEALDHGKYLVVWKKVDGRWKMARDMYNSSVSTTP